MTDAGISYHSDGLWKTPLLPHNGGYAKLGIPLGNHIHRRIVNLPASSSHLGEVSYRRRLDALLSLCGRTPKRRFPAYFSNPSTQNPRSADYSNLKATVEVQKGPLIPSIYGL